MEFKEHLKKYLSDKEIQDLWDSISEISMRALLLNNSKACARDILAKFPFLKQHPIVKNAYIYNPNVHQLGKSIEHFLGQFYIQEPSAMVPAYLLNANKDDIVLDLCAAPGGKTIQSSFLMKNLGLIVANDISNQRTNAIIENVERLGIGNVVITNGDFKNYSSFYKNYFTKIILDAPCSGSGMFKKDQKMIEDWSYNKVLKFANEQKEIITYAYDMLKPGGILCYSTCSFSFEENEEVIQHLLENSDAEILPIEENELFYVSKKLPLGIHLLPNLFPGDGQYVCLIKKPGIISNRNINEYENVNFGDYIFSLPNKIIFPKNLRIIRYGIKIGQKIKNKNEINYDYHYSRFLEKFDSEINIDDDLLKKVLVGLTIQKPIKKGFCLIKYQNNSICFGKSDGKIIKNHLPKQLRRQ